MLQRIPMYLVLAAHLALLVVCWFMPRWFDLEWVLLCCATPQLLMLTTWLVLGRANILVRLFVNAAALCYWAQFITHDFFTDEIVAYLSLLLAATVGATGVMRILGRRIEKVQYAELSDQTGIRPRKLQFTLRTVALLVSAISVLFAINARLKFAAVVFGNDALTAVFLLTAISSVLALWATLGEGRLAVRLLIYASVATAGITGMAAQPINLAALRYTAPIVREILTGYRLPVHGIHGVGHWGRVLENGWQLAAETGANLDVVVLFALFHDARRVNEDQDDGHGQRGAELARQMRASLPSLPDSEFDLLTEACRLHTDGLLDGDVTLQTCWDADRLDLGRVGITPSCDRLCTAAGRRLRERAHHRAVTRAVPEFVGAIWSLE